MAGLEAPPLAWRELPGLSAEARWQSLSTGAPLEILERDALVPFLRRQRWFAGKTADLAGARLRAWAALPFARAPALLALLDGR